MLRLYLLTHCSEVNVEMMVSRGHSHPTWVDVGVVCLTGDEFFRGISKHIQQIGLILCNRKLQCKLYVDWTGAYVP